MMIIEDLKPEYSEWLKIARRLQSEARKQEGLVIAKINVLLNQDGRPIVWSEPKTTEIEPKSRCDDLLELLSE